MDLEIPILGIRLLWTHWAKSKAIVPDAVQELKSVLSGVGGSYPLQHRERKGLPSFFSQAIQFAYPKPAPSEAHALAGSFKNVRVVQIQLQL